MLIVEDDENQLFIIEDSLRKMGFPVIGVGLGKNAIEQYRRNPGALIILDYNLPDMTGIDVIDELTKEYTSVDFITMTAYGNEKVAVEMMKRGARDYIVKDANFLDFLPSVIANNANRLMVEYKLRKSEEALLETREMYYDLFENSMDAIYVSSKDGKLQAFNKSMEKLLSYSKEELESLNLRDIYYAPIERLLFIEEIERKGYVKDFEVKLIDKHQKVLHCLITATTKHNSSSEIIGFSGIIHNITSRKEYEKKLAESEERYRNLFERIPLGLYISNPNGELIDVNQGFLKLLEIAGDKSLIKNLNTNELYVNPEDRNLWKQRMDKFGTVTFVFEIQTLSGKRKWVEDTARAVRNSDGTVKFYEGVMKDITGERINNMERENLISQLRAEKEKSDQLTSEMMDLNYELIVSGEQLKTINASKDKLFSIIAHDLKSPFTGFMGLANILHEDIINLSREEISDMASAMSVSARNIYELLTNLLEWSRLQGGLMEINFQTIQLRNKVDKTIQLLKSQADNKKISLLNDIKPESTVYADTNLLSSLFRNIIGNAIKFTPDNGYVRIGNIEDNGSMISFFIEDNGVGMSGDTIRNLFDLDKHNSTLGTRNEKGTGLGLILVKEMLDKQNGKIEVKSEIDKGTRFIITLPRNES